MNIQPANIEMRPYLVTKDFSTSKEDFKLVYDHELDMLVTHPQPKNLKEYYKSENYISHNDSNKSLVDKIYQWVKRYSIRRKMALITKYSSGAKTILDIGAGTGDFLKYAKKKDWVISGVEPNLEARVRAKEKGVDLIEDMKLLPETKYNVITLWHVLEHLPNLDDQIANLCYHLEDQGLLIIAVPNFKSFDAAFYKEHWAAYDVPRHLWHFSKTSIERLFLKNGVKLIQTKPMVFDSFYVSLLSETYKTNKQSYVRPFFVGLWSNLVGLRSKEYSSHIYILKKG